MSQSWPSSMKPRSTMIWPIFRLPPSALQLFSFFLGVAPDLSAALAAGFAAPSALAGAVGLVAVLAAGAAAFAASGFFAAGFALAAVFFGSFGFGVDIFILG